VLVGGGSVDVGVLAAVWLQAVRKKMQVKKRRSVFFILCDVKYYSLKMIRGAQRRMPVFVQAGAV